MKVRNMFKKQQGMTLIEMGVALAILAAVVGGALALYNSTSTSQKSTQLTTDLVAVRSATKQLHYGQGTYGAHGTNLNNVVITAGKVPGTIRNTTGTTLKNSFDGDVTVLGSTANFYITVTNIPQEACVNLLTGDGSWSRVHVGTAPTAANILTAGLATPIAPATAIATGGCTAATNTIHFVSN